MAIRMLGLLAGVAMLPAMAAAQSAPQANVAIEEVVVTAQRREQNLQDVPISVSAVTGEGLTARGVRSSDELALVTPGLNIRRQTVGSLVFIRGVGTGGAQAAQEGAIAIFVDGVYQPSPQNTTQALFNLERVEVLKGPQGTLFGRNATGGAIQYITKDPTFEPTGKFSVGYGNRDTTELNGYFATGLTSNIAIDLAAYYRKQADGFGTNLVTGSDVSKGRDLALRSKLLVNIDDDTTLKVSADYVSYAGSEGIVQMPIASSTLLDGRRGALPRFQDTTMRFDPAVTIHSYGASAIFTHDFGGAKFTSISGYRNLRSRLYVDVDTTPLPLLEIPGFRDVARQFSQELQLSGSSEKVDWIAGAYYLKSKVGYDPFLISGLGLTPAGLIAQRIDHSVQDTQSLALFGQVTYEILPDTRLTLGGRWTQDKRKYGARLMGDLFNDSPDAGFIPLAPANAFDAKKTFSEPTWRIGLDHRLNDDVLIYATYNRGFKSGIFNTTNPASPPVEPEILDAFEAGFKSTALDNRMRLNAAAFYYDYKNIQLISQSGASQLLVNAAKARIYGVEASLDLAVTERLTISAGASLLDHKYKSFPNAPNLTPNPLPPFGNTSGSADASGQGLIFTPDYTLNLVGRYVIPTERLGKFEFNAAMAYTDDFTFAVDGGGRLRQKGYPLLNASMEWTLPNDRVSVRLWGRNLTKEDYLVSAFSQQTGDTGVPGPGRTYGVSLAYAL